MNPQPLPDEGVHHRAKASQLARNTPTLALIGCGAFAEVFYLPALARFPDVLSKLILVDQDPERARKLVARFHAAECQTDYRAVLDRVDGVIVAVPHALHYPVSMAFLAAGVHVLCEKPLTLSAVEARDMIECAERAGVALATNHTQRLFPSNIKVRELLASGALGQVTAISYAWGAEFTWPTVSGFYFKESNRGMSGVLLDRGPHALDLVCWWLGEKPRLVSSQNDSLGGLDAVAHVKLKTDHCDIDIRLSWLSKLSNSYTIHGTEAEINNSFEGWWALPLKHRTGTLETIALPATEREYNDFARKIVSNFIGVITQGDPPLIPAREVLSSIELVEECYSTATPFDLPWRNVEGVIDDR